jgi:predicted signal transduction protein with EAL and GGDEF domain
LSSSAQYGRPAALADAEGFTAALARLLAGPGRPRAAILLFGLGQFTETSDALGRRAAERLLRSAAMRLRGCTPQGGLLARLGTEEIGLLQPDLGCPDHALRLGRQALAALGEPCRVGGVPVELEAYAGIALAEGKKTGAEEMLRRAGLALRRARAEGRGGCRLFEAGMSTAAQARQALKAGLRRALAREEFALHYQPLVCLRSGAVTCCEALLRWSHPERGLLPPAEFIPVAEESGLVVQIGRWALQAACRDAAGWPGGTRVAVNLSPVQLRSPTLLRDVEDALALSGLPPQRLELEITESVLLEDGTAPRETLRALRARGIRIALDDFGTGYASLSYLRRFAFDKLKLDRSFVAEMAESAESRAIVRAVIGLARSLRIPVTAEGVETVAQFEALRRSGYAEAQGHLLARPVAARMIMTTMAGLQRSAALAAAAGVDPGSLAPLCGSSCRGSDKEFFANHTCEISHSAL